jgi:elongation factor P--(R)-beta-lysine ligase
VLSGPGAPSDLDPRLHAGPVRVAGRAVEVAGRDLLLADAFSAVRVTLAAASPVAPGDLLVVSGTFDPEPPRLTGAVVEQRFAPRRPPSFGSPSLPPDAPPAGETERLRTLQVGSALEARAAGLRAVRAFFEAWRFLEVDTPSIVPSPGLDVHLDAFEVREVAGPSFRGAGYLVTSPEYQMKRLLAGGVPRCFQLARCYRRGEVGARHNPEFLMLEWYRAFAGVDEVIADTEALVRHVALALTGRAELAVDGARVDLAGPFERLPVAAAFERYAGVAGDRAIALATDDEDTFFRLLVDRVEPALAREPRPVFLVDYPTPFASLARARPDDPRVAERFELYAAGVELCNGFGELTDPVEQRARLERDQAERARRGKPVYPIDERFLAALEEGMPPSAGNALGVDRLLALCLGTDRIAGVLPFPIDWL